MDSLVIFLRPSFPSWIWIRYIQYATHRNNFTSPPKLAMPTEMSNSVLVTISPLGNIFWRDARFSTNNQNNKITVTSTSISSSSKHDFATYGEHYPSHVQRHALLSLLSHNSISSLYFFPFPQGLQHKRKLFIPCCH